MRKIKFILNTCYLFIRRLLALLLITPISVTLHCWIHLFKNVSARQVYLNLGGQFLQSGAAVKIGDPIQVPISPHNRKTKQKFIRNLYYNFQLNRVTASYTDKPHLIKKANESRG